MSPRQWRRPGVISRSSRSGSRRRSRRGRARSSPAGARTLEAAASTWGSRPPASTGGSYVTDEYKRRIDGFREEAGRIVSEGVERGAGRAEIRDKLEAAAQGKIAGRSSAYWEVVAGAFIGRGRSFSQLSSYSEAGIERYRIEAVLDEVTTETCRYLDGKVFSVGGGLRLFEAEESLSTPEEIKIAQPWIRERRDPKTGQIHLVANKGEAGFVKIATVERSGFGRQDDRGKFSGGKTSDELLDVGVGFPPYHGLCRTTTVPEFGRGR